MKKYLLALAFLSGMSSIYAQSGNKEAQTLVSQNKMAIGLSDADLSGSIISDYIPATPESDAYVYLQQAYNQIPVYNQLMVLVFRDGKLLSKSGGQLKGFENKVALQPHTPSVSATQAVHSAMSEKKLFPVGSLSSIPGVNDHKYHFGNAGVSTEDITAELMWMPYNNNKDIALVWQVFLAPKNSSDYWLIRIDAITGRFLNENNLTVSCNWDTPEKYNPGILSRKNAEIKKDNPASFGKLFKVDLSTSGSSPTIVNNASYIVVPFPAESPIHPGGFPSIVNNPWEQAPGNATSLKWHNNGTTDFNITRGNNVWTAEDRIDQDNSSGQPATSTTSPDPLTFNFTPNFGAPPTQRAPTPNQQFNTTNLFYWNNIIHDLSYLYGFKEINGNFQANNQGRGGLGNDYVIADAQDGGGTQNANFSTPPDGGRPRMQMYLWDTAASVLVSSPAAVTGLYAASEGAFSNANSLATNGPVTGQVVWYNDNTTGQDHDACGSSATSVSGKIAMINRGNCNFTVKVKNAQIAGAIGVIVVNNVPGEAGTMGGSDNSITIPSVMITQNDGLLLAEAIPQGLTATLGAAITDGDVDNGIISHEYTHGISSRLTGGPSQASCLFNGESMGEGISDYVGLMVTQNWALSTLNDGFSTPRSVGTYVIGQSPNGSGIRSQKYCTNMAINNKVYAGSISAESHNRGEIWCAVLWDMTWNIINQTGIITPNLFDINGNGGNVIALKLVLEGLKLQPCNPGFIDARNAILQADQNLFGGVYSCAIWEAFRRRGMGPNASQGSSDNVNDQTPDYSSALQVALTQSVTEVPEGENITYTNTVSTCSPVTNYLLTDTLPSNVTYISGGNYNATTRVVSFPVTLGNGETQTYSFTVKVNDGAYYDPADLVNEPFSGSTLPPTFVANSTTPANWTISSAQSVSPPNSAFTKDTSVVSVQTLTTANNISLPSNHQVMLSFMHNYSTEANYDGGVIEVSTNNGTSWTDLKSKWILNGYPISMDPETGTVLQGRDAFSGSSNGFIKTVANLSAFAGQNIKLRWLFSSDLGTSGIGWYVDDISLRDEAAVFMRSNLINPSGTRLSYNDTVALITPPGCVEAAIVTQPAPAAVCAGSNASFSVTTTGSSLQYQWQISTDGGNTFTNIPEENTASLNITGVTSSMNNNRYRVIVSNGCPSSVTSTSVSLTVSNPAAITSQPVNTSACEGQAAVFAVAASGDNISYQWQISTDGGNTFTDIVGATGPSYAIPSVTSSLNGNIYHAVISSCNPTPVVSSNATLTITADVTISQQPTNSTTCVDSNASFSINASGSGLTYQWQLSTDGGINFTNISGATSSTLTINAVTPSMNGNMYRVIVDNTCGGSTTSSSALLTTGTPASFTTQPQSATVCEGSNVQFSAAASGTVASYQWQVSIDGGNSFTDLTGQTSATMVLNNVSSSMNNNQYQLIITGCNQSTIPSSAASLFVNAPANITTQPTATPKCVGDDIAIAVTASGTGLNYQWQVSTDGGNTFTNIASANTSILNLNGLSSSDNGNVYHVVISAAPPCTQVTSSDVTLVVNPIPVTGVDVQPSDVVCAGSTIVLSGTGANTYQWDNGVQNNVSFSIGETTTFHVTGTSNGCSADASVVITVNPLPQVTISASPYTNLLPGLSTTITASVNQPGSVYSWTKDGTVIPGQSGSTIHVDENGHGTYVASFTDDNGCTGFSNELKIGDSTLSTAFLYPNPNKGHFFITSNTSVSGSQNYTVVIYDSKGSLVLTKSFAISSANMKIEINAPHLSHGTYMVVLRNSNGKVVGKGKLTIL